MNEVKKLKNDIELLEQEIEKFQIDRGVVIVTRDTMKRVDKMNYRLFMSSFYCFLFWLVFDVILGKEWADGSGYLALGLFLLVYIIPIYLQIKRFIVIYILRKEWTPL